MFLGGFDHSGLVNLFCALGITKDVVNGIVKTVASQGQPLVGQGYIFVQVGLGHSLALLDTIVESLGDAKRLHRHGIVVDRLIRTGLLDGVLVCVHHVGNLGLETLPHVLRERTSDVLVLSVEDLVEEGVQLTHTVVIGQWEGVGTLVTGRVVLVVTEFAVEWLHDVAHIVDQKAQGVRLCNVLIIIELFHKESIHVSVLIVFTAFAG